MRKIKTDKPIKKASIGGQAVMEGVMMRGVASMATAVRSCDGEISIESKRLKPTKSKSFWYRTPIIRGILNFCSSMYTGVSTLTRSAEALGEDIEPSKFENWLAKKTKIDIMSLALSTAVILGILFAVGLFVILPEFIAKLIFDIAKLGGDIGVLARNFSTGLIRITIFVFYILACSKMKDINRLFRYHGAEHKTINAYEHGEELTVANVQKYTTIHKRCGTTFMFLVMVVSILVFSSIFFFPHYDEVLFKVIYKIILLPLVAGLSYEVLKILALSDNIVFRIIRAPGMWLQKLTTKEPDDSMVEVAIAAFTTVMNMDADETIPEKTFSIKQSYLQAVQKIKKILPEDKFEKADTDWIFCEVLKVKRSGLSGVKCISEDEFIAIEALAKERATGRPLQYILGYTEFYGYKITVNENVLIPRPETELLAEKVISEAQGKTVLDLCTGSGAIAIAVAKKTNSKVTASDISAEALKTARRNAEINEAEIELIESDMFKNISAKFDIIVSNPPYIPSGDIAGLQNEVKNYEPKAALDGGADGLDFYRIIESEGRRHLNGNGCLMMEFGIGQKEALEKIFSSYSLTFLNDYNNIPRILIARQEALCLKD